MLKSHINTHRQHDDRDYDLCSVLEIIYLFCRKRKDKKIIIYQILVHQHQLHMDQRKYTRSQ